MWVRDIPALGGIAAAILVAGALSGCSSVNGGMESVANFMSYGATTAPPLPTKAPQDVDVKNNCPEIEVLDGTSAMRTYAGANQNPNVRYQFSLGDVERECAVQGNQLSIKVGIEGRVLLGPTGAPGSFTAPVRVAIRRDADHKAAVSQLYKVPVTVPPGGTEAGFSLVTDPPLLVPLLGANPDEDYSVVVGFDEAGSAAAPAKASPRHKSRRGQAAEPAQPTEAAPATE